MHTFFYEFFMRKNDPWETFFMLTVFNIYPKGKQKNIRFIGTINNMTGYVMNGVSYLRSKSSLIGKRGKNSSEFKKTMEFARKLGEASTLASELYKTVPFKNKSSRLFRLITGLVIKGFKKGNTENEVSKEVLAEIRSLVKKS